jgi:hypothetical protein
MTTAREKTTNKKFGNWTFNGSFWQCLLNFRMRQNEAQKLCMVHRESVSRQTDISIVKALQ